MHGGAIDKFDPKSAKANQREAASALPRGIDLSGIQDTKSCMAILQKRNLNLSPFIHSSRF
jgi:hypothetical protein